MLDNTQKIYSRKRLKKIKLKKFTKFKISFLLIFLGLLLIIIQIFISVYPIFMENCKSKARSLSTEITTNEVEMVMSNYDYNDLVYIERQENRRNFIDKNKNRTSK